MDRINFEDFIKIDLRVGEIKSAKVVENSSKLLEFTVDLGAEIGERNIVSGIKKFYDVNDLEGRKIIVLVNLEKKELAGTYSDGMILAAGVEAKLLTCDNINDLENGTKVS